MVGAARFDYTPADCVTFHDAIEHEVVPLARQLMRCRRPTWDCRRCGRGTSMSTRTANRCGRSETWRIWKKGVTASLPSRPRAGRPLCRHAGRLPRPPSRPSKADGGYCESFPVSDKPYIFMNGVGSHDDVSAAPRGRTRLPLMESRRNPLWWNQNGPMEFCEVASMGMELIRRRICGRIGAVSRRPTRAVPTPKSSRTADVLRYMAVVDAFEHRVYVDAPEAAAASTGSAKALDAKLSELWERSCRGSTTVARRSGRPDGTQIPHLHRTVLLHRIRPGRDRRHAGVAQRGRDPRRAVADYRSALACWAAHAGCRSCSGAAGGTFAFDRRTVGELMASVEEQLAALAV